MFGDRRVITFDHRIEGTWGTFASPAGRVSFLSTKGRLGPSSTDNEWTLTKQLAPVREVLSIKDMDFNQLLQRDLDDHRIAIDLIPYVLEAAHTGPAFFPPIIAVVLPFQGKQPLDHFPAAVSLQPELDREIDATLAGEQYGDVFKFEKVVAADGSDHRVCLARLSWNEQRAKLVVIDGQHRAMALVAINRTVNEDWRQSSGEKYETFYSERVTSLLSAFRENGGTINLAKVEFPVTLCWFPDCTSPTHNPHEAARKLFVDINKNAKPPSEARLILLSDTELVNVFTRELLNRVRKPEHTLPLYAIEYDNPDSDTTRPARWSVLTNLDMLKQGVLKLAFGPSKYFSQMCVQFGGRPNWDEMNRFMRERLNVDDLYPEEVEDGPQRIRRDAIGNRCFPTYDRDEKQRLLDRFANTVGDGLLYILSNVFHYKQHLCALKGVYEGWNTTGNNVGQLAKDALFEGMGMYWTLRDGHLHYEDRRRAARERRHTPPTQPDVSRAWEIISTSKKVEFARERCRFLLEKNTDPTEAQIEESESLYQSMNTQACQVGAYLAWGAVAQAQSTISLHASVRPIVEAWNAAFLSKRTSSSDRRMIFSRKGTYRLNAIRKLDTPLAVHYRYFWLELLCIAEAKAVLEREEFDTASVEALRNSSRRCYLGYLAQEQEKALITNEPTLAKAERKTKAHKLATQQLKAALKHWCGISAEDFEAWLAAPGSSADLEESTMAPDDDQADQDDDFDGENETTALADGDNADHLNSQDTL
jgi:hypothetical protein